MTVDSAYYNRVYRNDGETVYRFPHETLSAAYIEVYRIDASKNFILLVQDTDYTITTNPYRSPNLHGGEIVLAQPLIESDLGLSIQRKTEIINDQDFTYADGSFNAAAFENALDRLTFILQEIDGTICNCSDSGGEIPASEFCQPYVCSAYTEAVVASDAPVVYLMNEGGSTLTSGTTVTNFTRTNMTSMITGTPTDVERSILAGVPFCGGDTVYQIDNDGYYIGNFVEPKFSEDGNYKFSISAVIHETFQHNVDDTIFRFDEASGAPPQLIIQRQNANDLFIDWDLSFSADSSYTMPGFFINKPIVFTFAIDETGFSIFKDWTLIDTYVFTDPLDRNVTDTDFKMGHAQYSHLMIWGQRRLQPTDQVVTDLFSAWSQNQLGYIDPDPECLPITPETGTVIHQFDWETDATTAVIGADLTALDAWERSTGSPAPAYGSGAGSTANNIDSAARTTTPPVDLDVNHFTMELSVYFRAAWGQSNNVNPVWSFGSNSNKDYRIIVSQNDANDNLRMYFQNGTTATYNHSSADNSCGTLEWHHIAYEHALADDGLTFTARLYLGGQVILEAPDIPIETWGGSQIVNFARYFTDPGYLYGNCDIDNYRLTSGAALYKGFNYTPIEFP
jgi:hypothetical protein